MQIEPQLLERAQGGDRVAHAAIAAAMHRPILTLAMRMLSHRADAEDAAQEAVLKILANLDSYRGESKFSTWAHSVAARSILDFRQGAYRKEVVSFEAFSADLAEGLDLAAPDRAEDAIYLGQILVGCARALLLCLDGELRLAYVVGQVMNLPSDDGALICGVTPEAFRKRLSRARALVEAALQQSCGVVNPSAPCRCHRRLSRAKQLGRVGGASMASVDISQLRAVVAEMKELSARAAAYSGADPCELVPPELAERLRSAL